jgi:uncharacterized protein (TIGR00369 family)
MPAHEKRDFGSPAHRWIGIEPGGRSSAHGEARLAVRPEFLQEEGVVHGGIVAALLDATCVYALYPELGARDSLTSIEFKVNFLAPGLVDRGPIEARADVLKSGRTIALLKAVATQAGKPVAEGLFTYVFKRAE